MYGVAGDLLCGEAPDSLQECLPLRHGASLMYPFYSNTFARGGGRGGEGGGLAIYGLYRYVLL